MKLARYNPSNLARVSDFDEWFRHPFAGLPSLGQFFNLPDFVSGWTNGHLATDIHEDADNYYATFEVPGVKKEDVKIELNNRMLSVSVAKKEKSGESEQSFTLSRSVSVPEGVNPDKIGAKLEDGVLTVTLPKPEHRKPKTISIA